MLFSPKTRQCGRPSLRAKDTQLEHGFAIAVPNGEQLCKESCKFYLDYYGIEVYLFRILDIASSDPSYGRFFANLSWGIKGGMGFLGRDKCYMKEAAFGPLP